MCTSSCRAAACRRTARAGSRAGPASSCPCACSSRLFRRLFLDQLSGAPRRPAAAPSSAISPSCSATGPPSPPLPGAAAPSRLGRLRQAARSAAPRPCWPISPATPTASPSPTAASSPWIGNGVTFRWKDYRAEATAGKAWRQDHDADGGTSSSAASCSTSCPTASIASATTACSPPPRAPAPSPVSGRSSIGPGGAHQISQRTQRPDPETAGATPTDDAERRSPCPCCGGRMIRRRALRAGHGTGHGEAENGLGRACDETEIRTSTERDDARISSRASAASTSTRPGSRRRCMHAG